MATPVRTLSSAEVATGDPTRESHYDNLRADMLIALTEVDYGATAASPSSPEVSQVWMDTTLDVLYMSWDGATLTGIASGAVTFSTNGITLGTTNSYAFFGGGGGMVVPVGADKWVPSGIS